MIWFTPDHFLDVLEQESCWCHVICGAARVSQLTGAGCCCATSSSSRARQVIAVDRESLEDRHYADWLSDELAMRRYD